MLAEPGFLVGRGGRIVFANRAAGRLCGRGASELAGEPFTHLASSDTGKLERFLEMCARNRQLMPGSFTCHSVSGTIEVRCDGGALLPRRDGDPTLLFVRCRPKEEATDQFLLLNQKIADLTREILERRKAELQRDALLASERAARADAERTSRLKDEFLATLSHELRTPLNAVLGWAQLIQAGDSDAALLAQGLRAIERNARDQTRLIEDLLDMSRIVAGKIRLDVQRVDLQSVIQSAVETIRPAAEARRIRLRLALDPAAAVMGDPARLQQIVWNLLSNAVKFTPKDGWVQVVLRRVESHVEIVVEDSGEGIAPDFLPYVFDRLRQGDASTTRRHGGLGLGLAIVKELVGLHGGSVSAASRGPGMGARFEVVLPLMAVAEPQDTRLRHPASPPVEPAPPAHRGNLDGLNVLVVDDEADARELMRCILSACGARVQTARSAAEAIETLRAGGIDVLVSDIGMPGEDGFALIAAVRRLADAAGRVPAVALTAYVRSEDRRRALVAGFQMHLAKPVDAHELVTVLASLAGRTGLGDPGASRSAS